MTNSRTSALYYIYRDAQNTCRWKLYGRNMRIVCYSANGHPTMAACRREIDLVKASGSAVVMEEQADDSGGLEPV